MGGLSIQLLTLGPGVEEGREGKKGKEVSLGWGVQVLLFLYFKPLSPL